MQVSIWHSWVKTHGSHFVKRKIEIIIYNNSLNVFVFPSTLNDWFNFGDNIRNSESISIFKSKLLFFIHPVQSNIYNIFDPKRLKSLTRLRLGFSHLNEHSLDITFKIAQIHYVLVAWKWKMHHFNHQWIDLMSRVKSSCYNFESMSDNNKKINLFIRWLLFWWKQK